MTRNDLCRQIAELYAERGQLPQTSPRVAELTAEIDRLTRECDRKLYAGEK